MIRRIAGKVIDFLAQLEDFQKKLWLKKKFVVETNYCITLDRIPQEFYPEIAANDAQREEWVRLFAIDGIKKRLGEPGYENPLTTEFLKKNSTLQISTALFTEEFTRRLISGLSALDDQLDSVLVASDNFQAIQLLKARYASSVQCIYIDPPYNSSASEIIYKNDYKHSSWLSLLASRIEVARSLMKKSGVMQVAIDDIEQHRLHGALLDMFGEKNYISTIAIMHNPKGRDQSYVSVAHEYTLMFSNDPESLRLNRLKLSKEEVEAKYPKQDAKGRYRELPLRRRGTESQREDRPYMYFPFIADGDGGNIRLVSRAEYERIFKNRKFDDDYVDSLKAKYESAGCKFILPIRDDGSKGRWRWGYDSCIDAAVEMLFFITGSPSETIYVRDYVNDTFLPKSLWFGERHDASTKGTNILKEIVPLNEFDYPKSIYSVEDFLEIGSSGGDVVLDFFAGSGTTGHAAFNLARRFGQNRHCILVEGGAHSESVTLERLRKTAYSNDWKKGQPIGPSQSLSCAIKIIHLESYEDALNNLVPRRTQRQDDLLVSAEAQGADRLKEQYLLRYMLDVETRGSQSLLNVKAFADPTAYKLKVKRPGSDESREVNVDLIETFNWLIGLTVQGIAAPQTFTAEFERDTEGRLALKGRLRQDAAGPWWFRTVTGATPDGRRTLIIWRKLTGNPEQDNLVLDTWFTRAGYSAKDSEFGLIYVNGDNNLENLKAADHTWKVRLIEEDFHRLMFDTEGL